MQCKKIWTKPVYFFVNEILPCAPDLPSIIIVCCNRFKVRLRREKNIKSTRFLLQPFVSKALFYALLLGPIGCLVCDISHKEVRNEWDFMSEHHRYSGGYILWTHEMGSATAEGK